MHSVANKLGTITVVGAERHLPYDRPPLSKKFLSGEWQLDQIALRRPDALDDLNLTFRLGSGAVSLDRKSTRLNSSH